MASLSLRARPLTLSLALSLLWTILALGCEQGGGGSTLRVELIAPSGENPAASIADGTLRVRMSVAGGAAEESVGEIRDGLFDLSADLSDVQSERIVQVELLEGARRQIGAAPTFSPIRDTRGIVRIVVGPSQSCARLVGPLLSAPRRSPALATNGTYVHVLGGLDHDDLPSRRAEFVDLLELGADAFSPDLASGVGAARGLPFSEGVSVAISEERSVRFRSTLEEGEGERDVPLSVHAGASHRSAVATLGSGQVALLGGELAGAPVAEISWLDPDGQIGARSSLITPRSGAAACLLNGELLIAGGQAEAEPSAEWIVPRGDGQALPELTLLPRFGGACFVSPDQRSALLLGGVDRGGQPIAESEIVEGCPSACQVREGPTLPTPRSDAAYFDGGYGEAFVVGGRELGGEPSRLVSHLIWQGASPVIDELMQLERARAEASVTPLASGLFLVAGGEGLEGPWDDLEVCFPSELMPL